MEDSSSLCLLLVCHLLSLLNRSLLNCSLLRYVDSASGGTGTLVNLPLIHVLNLKALELLLMLLLLLHVIRLLPFQLLLLNMMLSY